MAAYNFQKRFVDKIKSGEKCFTIRRRGLRHHAKPGKAVQLYTGQRTKNCKKIIRDRRCLGVESIQITVGKKAITSIFIDGKPVKYLNRFAQQDGFDNLVDMWEFWRDFHGVGLVIKWMPPRKRKTR